MHGAGGRTLRAASGRRVRPRHGPWGPGLHDERGSVLTLLPALLVVGLLLGVVLIDLGAHLVALSRASALADAAALAAVSADLEGRTLDGPATSPRAAAAEVAEAGGGRLEACRCPPASGTARVRVSVPVAGLARPRLGAARQTAQASATVADPAPTARGRYG